MAPAPTKSDTKSTQTSSKKSAAAATSSKKTGEPTGEPAQISALSTMADSRQLMQEFYKQPYVDYHAQPHQEIQQLDSEEDQTAVIPIEHIVRPVREVYAQQPYDMKDININWSQWGVAINPKNRPSPYMFPAFEKQVEDMRKFEHKAEHTLEEPWGGRAGGTVSKKHHHHHQTADHGGSPTVGGDTYEEFAIPESMLTEPTEEHILRGKKKKDVMPPSLETEEKHQPENYLEDKDAMPPSLFTEEQQPPLHSQQQDDNDYEVVPTFSDPERRRKTTVPAAPKKKKK